MSADHTPRVPPEAVKAAVSATRSTEPWCELAISAALPAIHAERDRAWREALLAERAIEVAGGICLDTVAMVEIGPSAAQGVIEAAIGAALDSLQVSGAAQGGPPPATYPRDLPDGGRIEASGKGLSREERDALGKRVFDNAVFDGQSVKLVNWGDAAAVIETLESLGYTLAPDQPPAPRGLSEEDRERLRAEWARSRSRSRSTTSTRSS